MVQLNETIGELGEYFIISSINGLDKVQVNFGEKCLECYDVEMFLSIEEIQKVIDVLQYTIDEKIKFDKNKQEDLR